MSKLNTNAKRKRQKPQEAATKAATKAERFKWDPSYCAKIEKLGEDGLSAVEIRVELGIPASTWRLWIQTHPDFAEAVEEADDAARAGMEKLGRLGVKMGPGFNATAYIFLMKKPLAENLPRPPGPSDHWRKRRSHRPGTARP